MLILGGLTTFASCTMAGSTKRIKSRGCSIRAAVASDVDDATALAVDAAAIARLEKDLDAALNAIERALSLNASFAVALYIGAELYAFRGEPSTATAYAQRALRLSPFDPLAWAAHVAMATAAIHEGRYDDAATFFAKAARATPGHGNFLLLFRRRLWRSGDALTKQGRYGRKD